MTTLQNFQTSVDSTIIASANPSGAVGLAKEAGDTAKRIGKIQAPTTRKTQN